MIVKLKNKIKRKNEGRDSVDPGTRPHCSIPGLTVPAAVETTYPAPGPLTPKGKNKQLV